MILRIATETIVPIPVMLAIKKNIPFTGAETIFLAVVFLILIIVSIPNFSLSLRRARDQNRRDDLGLMESFLGKYSSDFGSFPLSSSDGKILNCLKPGDVPYKDEKGFWVVNPISCEWGKDPFLNLVSSEKYLEALPQDPEWEKGVSYLYLSNGKMYQLYAFMEGNDEAEVDFGIIARNLSCGSRICNVGRSHGCNLTKDLDECWEEEIFSGK